MSKKLTNEDVDNLLQPLHIKRLGNSKPMTVKYLERGYINNNALWSLIKQGRRCSLHPKGGKRFKIYPRRF